MKKKKMIIAVATAVALVAGAALYFVVFQKNNIDREANARHIIELACTYTYPCDNPYFDPGAVAYIGLGVETTPEEKAKMEEAVERQRQAWKDAVGSYFAPNSFDVFMSSSPIFRFLGDAYFQEQSISVKDITRTAVDDKFQTFTVTLLVNGEEKEQVFHFRNDENDLFTFIELR